MGIKRHKPEEIVMKLLQVDVLVGQGISRPDAIRQVSITEQTYYRWKKQYGGMGTDQLKELKKLQNVEFTNRTKWFSNVEILRQATSINAEVLELSGPRNPYPGKLGVIEEGAYADLLLINGNPLEDLRDTNTVRWVMMNGRLYDADSLTQRWPEQRDPEGFYWQNDGSIPERTTGN